MPRMLSLGTVKAILTPDRASDAARAEPTVGVVLWPSVVDIAVLLQAVAPGFRATLTRVIAGSIQAVVLLLLYYLHL
jgi:hypothetical protein